MKTGRGALTSEVRGEVETEDGVLVIRRVFVHHRLVAPENTRSVVEGVHEAYTMLCPLYRTLHRCIDFRVSYELTAAEEVAGPAGE